MPINKKIFKTFSLMIPLGIMFASPVKAEIIRSKTTDEFTQFGMQNPQCDGIKVHCFGFPNNLRFYYHGSADYCIREDGNGNCAEKGIIVFRTNDEEYPLATAKWVEIQSNYDQKYKTREQTRVVGNAGNCTYSTITSEGVTTPFTKCHVILSRDTYNNITKTWSTETINNGASNFPLASYAKCQNIYENAYNNPGTYVHGIGCVSSNTKRESSPNIAECEKCDPKTAIDKLGTPVLSSTPSGSNQGQGGINITTGEKFETKTDILGPIRFTRLYSSKYNTTTTMGTGWRHNYDKRLILTPYKTFNSTAPEYIVSLRFILENNEDLIFQRAGQNDPFYPVFKDQKNYKLTVDTSSGLYTLIGPNSSKEIYNSNGQLVKIIYPNGTWEELNYTSNSLTSIVNQYGQSLNIFYGDSAYRISKVIASSGDYVDYSYIDGILHSANFKGVENTLYNYTDELLTSITNPAGNTYAEFFYDATTKKATGSRNSLSGISVNDINITYNTTNVAVSQNGVSSTYNITSTNTEMKDKVGSSNIAGLSKEILTYGNGNVASYDKDAVKLTFGYDANVKLNKITSGGLTSTFVWDANTNKMTSSTESSANGTRSTALERDVNGNVTKKTITTSTGTRILNYTYTTYGRILTMTDPSGNTTTYTYYPDNDSDINRRGKLHTISKIARAVPHITTINAYAVNGNPSSITEPNGATKEITYDYHGRILSETIMNLTTSYQYDANGNLTNVNYPNGYNLIYSYDELNRLIGMSDSTGAQKTITLDSKGNPTSETISTYGQIMAVYNRSYDAIDRIKSVWREDSNEVENYTYSSEGNITNSTNAINQSTTHGYDYFKRMISANTSSKIKEFTYDNDSNVSSVSINYSKTSYTYNDFGEVLSISSPDTGLTKFEYNIAARETKKIDSDGTVHLYKKDELGRIYDETHRNSGYGIIGYFHYDYNGVGNLMVMDNSGGTGFDYDGLGRIIWKEQDVVGTVTKTMTYTYNNIGNLETVTYPSGAIVSYSYTNGKVTSINMNGTAIIEDIKYFPFSNTPISWTWGSGGTMTKTFDANGKLTNLVDTGIMQKTINMNGIYNITQVTDSNSYPGNNIIATYNGNNQISNAQINDQSITYTFDSKMNRTQVSNPFISYAIEDNKIYSMSNQPSGFSMFFYDGRGNTKNNGRGEFTYSEKNNLKSSITSEYQAVYDFNAFDQRVSKTVNNIGTYFMYDGDNLISEYDSAGNTIVEHIYIGNTPIAAFKNNQIYSVHTDEIGTPRFITDSSNNQVWAWHNTDIFGGNQPVSDTNFTYNLRFAGQYFDFENGLHYNYYRTYDPKTGRYMQSDPIGLNGGDHTYNYVNGNPLSAVDPLGLDIVYYYQPIGKHSSYSHAALGSTKTNKVISLMPEEETLNILWGGGGRITIESKLSYEGMAEKILIKATEEQEAMLLDLIAQGEHPNTYSYLNINGENCAAWAQKILEKIGINVGVLPGIKYLTPYALYNGIEQYNNRIKLKEKVLNK
jgi:RHS repeat-associated protein